MIYKAFELKCWAEDAESKGGWWPARPISYWSFRRVYIAWGVLVGRYDALDWTPPTQHEVGYTDLRESGGMFNG